MRNSGVLLFCHFYRCCRRPTPAVRQLLQSSVIEFYPYRQPQARSGQLLGDGGFLLQCPHRINGLPHLFLVGMRGFRSAGQGVRSPTRWESYDPGAFAKYYRYRPFMVAYRAMLITAEIGMLTVWHLIEKDIRRQADKVRRSLIRLGPFYIKLGQALSTRPDILPSDYCLELAKLQDRIPPFPTSEALKYVEEQLGSPASKVFADISDEPVAAASLGQVYKAQLHSGEKVAVKVQRPGILEQLALDAHLLRLIGGQLQRFIGGRGDLVAVVDELAGHMFEEVDYLQEGRNAERFSRLYGLRPASKHGRPTNQVKRAPQGTQVESTRDETSADPYGDAGDGAVKVPKIYWDFTTRGILTMEWIDGIKLTDKEALSAAKLDTQHLVDQGVLSSLRQLLEEGYFHADPHPGNVLVTKEGILAFFDFGMMSELRREYRIGLIRTLIHFVNRDSEGLARDFVMLDFIPEGTQLGPIAQALRASFGDEETKSQLDFQGIMNQLWTVMYKFNFRLSPQYAMVVRALGSLEGTATTLDPGFRVVTSAYPFIVGRLLADPDPQMRETLRELLIRKNGSIRWHRLERLVVAVADQTAPASGSTSSGEDGLGRRRAGGIRGAFDTRAVASAALDVTSFILSGEGVRVRILLVKDIVRAFDALLKHFYAHALELEKHPAYVSWVEKRERAENGSRSSQHNQESHGERSTSPKVKSLFWSLFGNIESINPFSWSKKTAEEEKRSWSVGPEGASHEVHSGPSETGVLGSQADRKEEKASDSDTPQFEDFPERLRVGLLAFAKAVESDPEVWLPLMAHLAAKPEARALGCDVVSALAESYCHRTTEAAFLFISRQLHRSGH